VTDKYSDHLPSFKDSEEEEGEVRGYRRFTDWVDDGYSKAGDFHGPTQGCGLSARVVGPFHK
jgi:hypothetical protein